MKTETVKKLKLSHFQKALFKTLFIFLTLGLVSTSFAAEEKTAEKKVDPKAKTAKLPDKTGKDVKKTPASKDKKPAEPKADAKTKKPEVKPKPPAKDKKMSDYKVVDSIKPKGLEGISGAQIDDHWKLYEAYVTQVNSLNAELAKMRADGQDGTPLYADRRRRYGFELNGMVLHEYYFSTLTADKEKTKEPEKSSPLYKAIERDFGSFEKWKTDFQNAGKTRGIGWAILYADTQNHRLSNHFIAEHEDGHIAGWTPVLVMDVWEHAYIIDYKAGGRAKYIAAFVDNIDWRKTETRYNDVLANKTPSRI